MNPTSWKTKTGGTSDCELLYLHTSPYVREAEAGIRPNDPYLDFPWPLDFFEISMRDATHPLLNDQFMGVEI